MRRRGADPEPHHHGGDAGARRALRRRLARLGDGGGRNFASFEIKEAYWSGTGTATSEFFSFIVFGWNDDEGHFYRSLPWFVFPPVLLLAKGPAMIAPENDNGVFR